MFIMYYLDYVEGMTFEEISNKFRTIINAGYQCCLRIGLETIYSSDNRYEEKIKSAIKSYDSKNIEKYKQYADLLNDPCFVFYLNIIIESVEDSCYGEEKNKLNEIVDYYLRIYSNKEYESLRDIHLFAYLASICDESYNYDSTDDEISIIREKITFYLQSLSDYERKLLPLTICNLEKYNLLGDYLSDCFNCKKIKKYIKQSGKN